MPTLTLDPDTHVYRLDGKRLMGVTEILKSSGLAPASEFRNGSIDHAMLLGEYVHQATALYDRGELDMDSLDDAIEPYLLAWVQFTVDYKTDWKLIEYTAYHTGLFYAGTLDRAGLVTSEIGTRSCVVDIKTGEPKKWHAAQVEAYRALDPQWAYRMVVYLKPDGTYEAVWQNSGELPELWRAAVLIAQWKRRRESQ